MLAAAVADLELRELAVRAVEAQEDQQIPLELLAPLIEAAAAVVVVVQAL
jgi:hypothetical protein